MPDLPDLTELAGFSRNYLVGFRRNNLAGFNGFTILAHAAGIIQPDLSDLSDLADFAGII